VDFPSTEYQIFGLIPLLIVNLPMWSKIDAEILSRIARASSVTQIRAIHI